MTTKALSPCEPAEDLDMQRLDNVNYEEVVAILRQIYPEWDADEIVKVVREMLDEQRRVLGLSLN